MAQPEPRQPPVPGPLDTPQKLQAYLNSCPPGLTEQLDLRRCHIASLNGVQFPIGVRTELLLSDNQITTMAGVIFPPGLEALELDNNKITSLEGVQFPTSLTSLYLNNNQIASLQGVQFPPGLDDLELSSNKITSLQGVQFPPGLTELSLSQNKITSLAGVQFPATIKDSLSLGYNQITSLKGVQFPSVLSLWLNNNQITSLSGVQFPPGLLELDLSNNAITSLYQLQLPHGSTIDLKGNPVRSLYGIINPDEYLMDYLKHHFPSEYFREFYYQRKDAKMAEQSALKTARQSQKAELKELSQQSMRNQLSAVTSFLREGMKARAEQHANQLLKDRHEKPTTYEQSLFYAKLNEKMYPVPMIEEMSMQDVLNYLNDNYYISVLHNCGGMHLHKNGVGQLESTRTLAGYHVASDEVLNVVCGSSSHKGGFSHSRSKKRRPKKRSQTRRNKSKKN
jgi:Leucine-rich repeat (LRR) protein